MQTRNQHIAKHINHDAMGNILTQERHNRQGEQFDDLSYHYQRDANGNLERNRLYLVNDAIPASLDSTDIDDTGTFVSAINQLAVIYKHNYKKKSSILFGHFIKM